MAELSEIKSDVSINNVPVSEDRVYVEDDRQSTNSHKEVHFQGAEIVRDIVVGMSDGLTVPFALAAGLSTLDSSAIVVTAGLAEIAAGAISMGLGGWLAGRSEIEHYDSERKRESWEVDNLLNKELEEIVEIFEPYGLDRVALAPLLAKLSSDKEKFIDFMMRFELSLEKPSNARAWQSALTIGLSYLVGGLVPLFPYFFESNAQIAFYISLGLTLVALFVFGLVKGYFTGTNVWTSGVQTFFVGGIAAAVSYGIGRGITSSRGATPCAP